MAKYCAVQLCCYVVLSKIIPSATALANDRLIHELVVALFWKQTHCVKLRVFEIAFDTDRTPVMQRHFELLGCLTKKQSLDLTLIEHEVEPAVGSLKDDLSTLEPNPQFVSSACVACRSVPATRLQCVPSTEHSDSSLLPTWEGNVLIIVCRIIVCNGRHLSHVRCATELPSRHHIRRQRPARTPCTRAVSRGTCREGRNTSDLRWHARARRKECDDLQHRAHRYRTEGRALSSIAKAPAVAVVWHGPGALPNRCS